MIQLNENQANWIADLLEKGHIHYEMTDYFFNNASYNNGEFVVEFENRRAKEVKINRYNREQYVAELMNQPKTSFKHFLVRYDMAA